MVTKISTSFPDFGSGMQCFVGPIHWDITDEKQNMGQSGLFAF